MFIGPECTELPFRCSSTQLILIFLGQGKDGVMVGIRRHFVICAGGLHSFHFDTDIHILAIA